MTYSFEHIKKTYNLKHLTVEQILNDSLKQLLLNLPKVNLYHTCTEFFFLKTCQTCMSKNKPTETFCTNCGDLLNIKSKCNINLGE